jgi:CDP-paratose 2-epimerase
MNSRNTVLVTGGAGFIGANTVARLLSNGYRVVVVDNFSREGSELNRIWLESRGDVVFHRVDIRDNESLTKVIANTNSLDAIIHLAGQVAVTSSVANPREDFEVNALGTFNVLEAARQLTNRPLVIFASTNKVYGRMESVEIAEETTRYAYKSDLIGVSEATPLDFHSPYGCSKGAADQYVRDYSRIYGLPTVVLRQSCIYGPRQFGVEDQGWAAWFTIAACLGLPITIYGDGKQVRDMLHVDDLTRVYLAAIENRDSVDGLILNIGGGPGNALSIWSEFGLLLEEMLGHPIPIERGEWRQGDQPIYISDISRAKTVLGWTPSINPSAGLRELFEWVTVNLADIERVLAARLGKAK